jgi:hypothetical protein
MRVPQFDRATATSVARLLVRNSPSFAALKDCDPRGIAFAIAHMVLHATDIGALAERTGLSVTEGREIVPEVARDLEPVSLALRFADELERAIAQDRRRAEEQRDVDDSSIRDQDRNDLPTILAKRLEVKAAADWRSMIEERPKAGPLLDEWRRYDASAQRRWLVKLLHGRPDAVAPFLRMCIKDPSDLSFDVNRHSIEALIPIDELATAARAAVSSVADADEARTLESFLAWQEKRQGMDNVETALRELLVNGSQQFGINADDARGLLEDRRARIAEQGPFIDGLNQLRRDAVNKFGEAKAAAMFDRQFSALHALSRRREKR